MTDADRSIGSPDDQARAEGWREIEAMSLQALILHFVSRAQVLPAAHPAHPDEKDDPARRGKKAAGQTTTTTKEGWTYPVRPNAPFNFSDVDQAIERAVKLHAEIGGALEKSGLSDAGEIAYARQIVVERQKRGSTLDLEKDVTIAVYSIRKIPEIVSAAAEKAKRAPGGS